jgi:hypothetical protein
MSRTIRNNEDLFWDDKFKGRDKKAYCKSPSYFKKMKGRIRRAKEKDALKHIDDETTNIPVFKKTNDWEWD